MRLMTVLGTAACVGLLAAAPASADAIRIDRPALSSPAAAGPLDMSAARKAKKAKKATKKKKKARRGSDINSSGARPAPARSNRP